MQVSFRQMMQTYVLPLFQDALAGDDDDGINLSSDQRTYTNLLLHHTLQNPCRLRDGYKYVAALEWNSIESSKKMKRKNNTTPEYIM